MHTLEAGGNAIDAAVAAALTLGVVDGQNSGIGGGCFILVRLASGKVVAIDGRETAPALATRDMFVRDGKAVPDLSQTGPLAVGVPGELAALERLSSRYGRVPLQRLLQEAADLARGGVAISREFADALAGEADGLRRFRSAATIFLHPDHSPLREGEILRQPDLADTYEAISVHGVRWFYGGPFARRTEDWMREHDGLLRRSDFRSYRAVIREPVETTYRGYSIIGFPPPSSGGVHVAQILNILEHFDLRGLGSDSADFAHVTLEAMKLAFADRAYWLGDPDFVAVPRGLISKAYADRLVQRIRRDRTTEVPGHGSPPDAEQRVFRRHTTHFSVADGDGNWVAITATINTSFGSKVVVPGTGVILNNQMDDFAAQPGVPNYFGLVGADANAVAPRKRPLSSMSPTLVLKDGSPVLCLGAAGGPTIISQVVLGIVRTLDFGATPAEALAAPRLHHQWRPDEAVLEKAWDPRVARELERRGHRVRWVDSLGVTQAVGKSAAGLTPAADPRAGGRAAVTDQSPPRGP